MLQLHWSLNELEKRAFTRDKPQGGIGVGRNTSISCWAQRWDPQGALRLQQLFIKFLSEEGDLENQKALVELSGTNGEVRARAELFGLLEERRQAAAEEHPPRPNPAQSLCSLSSK